MDETKVTVELEATHLKGDLYAVRPKGQLGTCGFYPRAWTVQYISARSEKQALQRASKQYPR